MTDYSRKPYETKNLTTQRVGSDFIEDSLINSFIEIDGQRFLNFGTYKAMQKLAKKSRGLLCPITKGTYLNKPKLTPKEGFTCSVCKYCITKSKPTFIQH